MAADTSEYSNEQVEYPEHAATVVDTVTINGTAVDIVEHRTVRQTRRNEGDPEVTVNRYEALRAGEYELRPASVSFRVNDGSHHKAGDWSGSSPTRATRTGERNPSLGYSKTAKGAVTAARKALELDAQYTEYGPAAIAAVRTISAEEYGQLDPAAPIEPGDVVVGWGHGNWRQGVAVKVTASKVFFLFTTPSGAGHLTNGSGKHGEIRLVRTTNPTPEPAPVEDADAEITIGTMYVNVDKVNEALARVGNPTRLDAEKLPASFASMGDRDQGDDLADADRELLTAVVGHETTGAETGYIVDADDQARAERLVARNLLCQISQHEFGTTDATNVALSAALRPGDPLPWAPGYVRTECGHSTPATEWRAGFHGCEQCPVTASINTPMQIGVYADGAPVVVDRDQTPLRVDQLEPADAQRSSGKTNAMPAIILLIEEGDGEPVPTPIVSGPVMDWVAATPEEAAVMARTALAIAAKRREAGFASTWGELDLGPGGKVAVMAEAAMRAVAAGAVVWMVDLKGEGRPWINAGGTTVGEVRPDDRPVLLLVPEEASTVTGDAELIKTFMGELIRHGRDSRIRIGDVELDGTERRTTCTACHGLLYAKADGDPWQHLVPGAEHDPAPAG